MLKILALAAYSLAKLVCQMAANCWPTMTLLFHIFEWIPKIGQRLEEILKPSFYSEPGLFIDIKISLSREDITVCESYFSWITLRAKTAEVMFGPVTCVLQPHALGRFIVTVVAFVKHWCNIRRCHVERETPGATWSSYRKPNSPGRLSAVVVDLMNSLSVHKSVEMKSLFVLVGVVNTEGWIYL